MSTTQQRTAQRSIAGARALRIKQFNMRYSTVQAPPQLAGMKRSADHIEGDISAGIEHRQKRTKPSDALSMPGSWPEDSSSIPSIQTTPEHADRRRLTPTAPAKKPSRIPVPVKTPLSKPSTAQQPSISTKTPSSRRAPTPNPRSTPASRMLAQGGDKMRDAHRITKPSTPSANTHDRARRLLPSRRELRARRELQAYRDAHALEYKQAQLDVHHAEELFIYWRDKFERKAEVNFKQASDSWREGYNFSGLESHEFFAKARHYQFKLTELHPRLEKLRREAESDDCLREVKLSSAEFAAVLTRAERKRPCSKVPVSVKAPTTTPSATDCAKADTRQEPESTPAGESVACVDKTTSTQTPEDPREAASLSVASTPKPAEPVNEEVPEASGKVDGLDQSSQVTSAEQVKVSQVFLPPAPESVAPVNGETPEAPTVIDEMSQSPQATSTEQIQISRVSQQDQQQAALPVSHTPEVVQTPAPEPVQVNIGGDAVNLTPNGAFPEVSRPESSPVTSEYAHAMLLFNHSHHFGPYGMEGKDLLEKLIFDPVSGDMVYFIARGQEVIGCRCGQEMVQDLDHNEEKSDCAMNIILNQLKDVCQADWEKSLTMDSKEGEMLVKKDMEMMIRASTEFADSVSGLNDYKNRMVWGAYAETVQTSFDKQYNPQAHRDRQKATKASMREKERQTRADLDNQREWMACSASLRKTSIADDYSGHGVGPPDETVHPATEPRKVHGGDADGVEIVTDLFCGGCNEALEAHTIIPPKPKMKFPVKDNVIIKCRCKHINVQYPYQVPHWAVLEDFFPDDESESKDDDETEDGDESQLSRNGDGDTEDASGDDGTEDEAQSDAQRALERLNAQLQEMKAKNGQMMPGSQAASQKQTASKAQTVHVVQDPMGGPESGSDGETEEEDAKPTSIPNHQSHPASNASHSRQDRPCGGCNNLLKWFMNDCWLCEPHKATPEFRQRHAQRISGVQRGLKQPAKGYTPREVEKRSPPSLPNKPVQDDEHSRQMEAMFQTPPESQASNINPTEPDHTTPDDEPDWMIIDDASYYSSPTVSPTISPTVTSGDSIMSNATDENALEKPALGGGFGKASNLPPPNAPWGPRAMLQGQQQALNGHDGNRFPRDGKKFGTVQKPVKEKGDRDGDIGMGGASADGVNHYPKDDTPIGRGPHIEESEGELADGEQEEPAKRRHPKKDQRGRQSKRGPPVPRSGGQYQNRPRSPFNERPHSRDRRHNVHNDWRRQGPPGSRSEGYDGHDFNRRGYQDRGERNDSRRGQYMPQNADSYAEARRKADLLRNKQHQRHLDTRRDYPEPRRNDVPLPYQGLSGERLAIRQERLDYERQQGYATARDRYEPTHTQRPERNSYEAQRERENQTRCEKGKGKAQYNNHVRGQSEQNWSRRGQAMGPEDYTRAEPAYTQEDWFGGGRDRASISEVHPNLREAASRQGQAKKRNNNREHRRGNQERAQDAVDDLVLELENQARAYQAQSGPNGFLRGRAPSPEDNPQADQDRPEASRGRPKKINNRRAKQASAEDDGEKACRELGRLLNL